MLDNVTADLGDWISILFILAGLLAWMFQAITGWRPDTSEKQEHEAEDLDDIFGPEEPIGDRPPTRPQQGSRSDEQPDIDIDEEFARALGIPIKKPQQAKEKQPPPAQVRQLQDPPRSVTPPPVRQEKAQPSRLAPPPVPAKAQPPARPSKEAPAVPMWEKRLAEARQSTKLSERDRRLASQFEKQGRPATAKPATADAQSVSIHDLLRNAHSAKTAIILREVLGPAPGTLPLGRASGWEAEAK